MTYIVFLWGRQGIATNTQYDSLQFSTMKNTFSFVVVLSLIRLSMQVQDEEVKRNRKRISEIHNYIDYVRDQLDEMQHEHHWLRRGERKYSRRNHPNTDSSLTDKPQAYSKCPYFHTYLFPWTWIIRTLNCVKMKFIILMNPQCYFPCVHFQKQAEMFVYS